MFQVDWVEVMSLLSEHSVLSQSTRQHKSKHFSLYTQYHSHPFFTAVYTGAVLLLWLFITVTHSLVLSHFRWYPCERWWGEGEQRSQRPHPGATRSEKPVRVGGPEAPLVGCLSWTWGNGGMRGSEHGGVCSSSLTHAEMAPASGQSCHWCWVGEWGAHRMEECCCCTR